jgi:hypothetical protein
MATETLGTLNDSVQSKLKPVRQILLILFAIATILFGSIALHFIWISGSTALPWLLPSLGMLLFLGALILLGLYGIAWLYVLYRQRREQKEDMFP